MPKNKVHYDIKNVYFAPLTLTDGVPTWGTPIRMPGAISMDLAAQGEVIKLRADGMDYYVVHGNSGYEGDINFALVPDEFKTQALGEELTTTEKVLIENAMKDGQPFAFLWEFSGDVKARRHVLYNCTASRPNMTGENKDNQKEPDTESTTITASPLENGDVKASTTEDTVETVYNSWFTEVWTKLAGTGEGA